MGVDSSSRSNHSSNGLHCDGVGTLSGRGEVDGGRPANANSVDARGPWPEDEDALRHGQQAFCCRQLLYPSFLEKWSFSYMNPILSRGAQIHTELQRQQKRQKRRRRRRRRSSAASLIGDEIDRGSSSSHLAEVDNGDAENDDGGGGGPSSSTAAAPSSSRLPQQLQLTQDDLYAAPSSMRVSVLRPRFDTAYVASDGNLTKTLWNIASPSFLPAGFCQLITVVAQVAVPVFVWRLLNILEANPSTNVFGQAIPYVILILAADVANAYGTHRQRFLAMKSGVTIRVAVIGAIYERVLRLTPAGRRGLTTGAVTNLFAIDAQKLFEVTAEGHLLWSAPLSMLLVAIMLVVIVGWSMAVGIALLVLFVPVVQAISNRMMEIRKERVKVTDARVEIVNAMLQGIKVTKLNNYEGKYIERIRKVRDQELGLLRRELYVWSMTMAVQFISPVVASAGAFAAYVLTGNILTTADAFTALLLFNALRFPINYASRLVGKVAQARESARRISLFMRRQTRAGSAIGDCDEDGGDSNLVPKSRIGGTEPDSSPAVLAVRLHTYDGTVIAGTKPTLELEITKTTATTPNGEGIVNGHCGNKPSPTRSMAIINEDDVMSSLPSLDNKDKKKPLLVIKNGMFYTGDVPPDLDSSRSWDGTSDSDGFAVAGVNCSVSPGEILAVVGPVGSGKSTIINAIIGMISVSPHTTLETKGRVAYASQVAFILNATLRDNILFGNELDVERYERVLDACCLRTDVEGLKAGDRTEIGERGVTLSGGQKQRVSLARAVYSNPNVALFDDPLSALDAGTARRVFDGLFERRRGVDGLLSETAVVLVTHASHFLNQVDRVMVVVDGAVPFCGTWKELSEADTRSMDDEKSRVAINSILNAVQENGNADASDASKYGGGDFNHSTLQNTEVDAFRQVMLRADNLADALMTHETREHGLTQNWAWTLWFRHAGGWAFTLGVLLLFVLEKVFYFGTEWWISVWTEAVDDPLRVVGMWFPPQTQAGAQLQYLEVYMIVMLLGFVCAFFRTIWIVSGGIRCSRNLYATMTHSVLHSPMVYFETTPMGRLLNRFTYDAEILDITLVWSMSMLLIAASWFVAALVVMVVILPWMCIILIPISGCYITIHRHYRKSGADLQRLDALSRSPLQTMLAEGIEGSATIRTFRKELTFVRRFQGFADKSTAAQMNFLGAQRWLGVRIELLGAVIVFSASLLVIIFNASFGLGAGLVALLIRWSAGFTISLSFLLDNAAEAEGAVTAIERIQKISEIKQEQNFEKRADLVDDLWPSGGELEFRDVRMRYRPRLPLSLDGLSFRVGAGEHCGVVGRTGAGKSSLLTALFRLVEIEDGAVSIDGVDLSEVGLSDIRGRPNGISIIPQDPFLFAGTLRECLDPFGSSSDEGLLDALASVRMLPPDKGQEVLDSRVEEGGTNYSVGERSLLVLARAILARPKLLLMDEATANIDGETDNFIQRMLRTRFAGTTLLTIAHRLETIMDYDKILVMDNGRAAEFGTPSELIENNGMFTELVNATGDGAAALIAMAREATEQRKRSSTFE